MSKQAFINYIASNTDVSKKDVEAVINMLPEALKTQLTADKRAVLPGIGIFNIKHRPARQGRNPSTGESISIAARDVVTIKPVKEFKDKF